MTTNEILMLVFIPVGVIIFVSLLVYILGNVYNGLITRRSKIVISWHELVKGYTKSLNLIPSLLQNIAMDEKLRDNFSLIYTNFKKVDISKVPASQLAKLIYAYQTNFMELKKKSDEVESIPFVDESLRYARFSITFYNHNVESYVKFKNLPVNRTMAKIFKFQDYEIFNPDIVGLGNTTLDLRVKKID